MSAVGKLYGLGVGPGDPELLTLKAIRLLKTCDAIAIPQRDRDRCVALGIAAGAVPEILSKPILALDMPMARDGALRERASQAAAERLTAVLQRGQTVAFLTLGDPSIYSTFGYLSHRVARAGIPVETVPGIPSFCGAAAALGEPLCLDREALYILPAGGASGVTRVYMKGGAAEMQRSLQGHTGPVFGVQNVGMAGERLFRSREEIPEETGYFTLIIAKETEL